MAAAGRAELLDRKRRLLAEYLAAGQTMVQCLSDSEVVPTADDVAPLIDRRDVVLGSIRDLDLELTDTPALDPASEIVAENALRRALESSADLDQTIADALMGWQARLASALTDIGVGRKTLRAYRSTTTQDHRVVDEAA